MVSQTLIPILIAVVVILIVVFIAWLAIRRRRSQKLRQKFGPEYDYLVEKAGDQHTAEETLLEREKRVKKLAIQDLDPERLERYRKEWIEIQAGFVDKPHDSVEAADRLITEVLVARGFPVADFDQRAADISVLYPNFVSNYRQAHSIAQKGRVDRASTEDLRQAMVRYRSLFKELLGADVLKEETAEEEKEATLS